MWIDIALVAILIIFTIFGFFSGFLIQLSRIVAAVVAILFAGSLGAIFTVLIKDFFSVTQLIASGVGFIIAWVFIYFTITIIASAFIKVVKESKTLLSLDMLLGIFLGLLKGSLVVLVLLFGLSMLFVPLSKRISGFAVAYSSSWSVYYSDLYLFNKFNVYSHILPSGILKTVKIGKRNPVFLKKQALKDKKLKRIINNPRFAAILKDKKLLKAINDGNFTVLFKDRKFVSLLNDSNFMDALKDLPEWNDNIVEFSAEDTKKEKIERKTK